MNIYDVKLKKINEEELTFNQMRIFEVLLKHDEEYISAKQICEEMYKRDFSDLMSEKTISVHISRINKKFPHLIRNRRQVGYYILEEVKIT